MSTLQNTISRPISRRGESGFLGWNTRYRGAEDLFALEHALIDIGVGVNWLKEQARANASCFWEIPEAGH